MFEDGQLYAPVVTTGDGAVVVELAADHPGINDPEYRARRNQIAALALDWAPGKPIPEAHYTEQEHEVWAMVSAELSRKHVRLACRAARDGGARLQLPTGRIPQLDEVSDLLAPLTGFRYLPAAGLVPLREFYGALADRTFWSTQYIRHHSVPLYTPEPDVVHEVIGHATTLADDGYAALYQSRRRGRTAGRDVRRAGVREPGVLVLAGVRCRARAGGVKAYGAGLLSSYGEIEEFVTADLRPLDIARMGVQTYDIGHYQPVLFAADSWAQVQDVVGGFFADVDDDQVAALPPPGAADPLTPAAPPGRGDLRPEIAPCSAALRVRSTAVRTHDLESWLP